MDQNFITTLVVIFLSSILVENLVLSKFLGMCPFLGVTQKTETAAGMGIAVTFILVLTAILAWLLNAAILFPLKAEYLQILGYILIIASLVQFVETVIRKFIPPLYNALGIYLPLITTNCAVIGVPLINTARSYGMVEGVIYALGSGTGFTLALIMFSGVREKLARCDIPESIKGVPVALFAATLVAMSFFGFQGLFSN
jgi:electron transport complex protein RnfA